MKWTSTVWRVLAAGLLLLAPAAWGQQGHVSPIGTWVSARGAVLEVTEHATCTFIVPTARADGDCTWRESEMGGILLIQYQATAPDGQPTSQVLYLDIRWVNQLLIGVNGEAFRRTR